MSTPERNQNQSTACDELHDLLPAYAIGALDHAEAEHVRTLLQECPEQQAELDDYIALSGALYERIEPVAPPVELHDRLMEQIRQQKADTVPPRQPVAFHENNAQGSSAPRSNQRLLKWGLAIAAMLAIISNLMWSSQLNNAQQTISNLNGELDETRQTLSDLETEYAQYVAASTNVNQQLQNQQQDIVQLISVSNLERVALASTGGNGEAALATLLWEQGASSGRLISTSLPDLPANETYQLWVISGEQPISAGVFNRDENGIVTFPVSLTDDITTFEAIAISVEPEGGSDAPTTDPIALAPL